MNGKLQPSRKIIILAHYCGDLDGRYSNRFVYIASLLSKVYDVELITSNFYHTKKVHKTQTGHYPFKVTLINEKGYKKNVGIKRIISHWIFSKNVSKYLRKLTDIDLVYVGFPSLSLAEVAFSYSFKINKPLIVDVQDLWPEAFENRLKGNSLGSVIYKYLEKKVYNIYSHASHIVTVSDTFLKKIENKTEIKSSNVTYIGTLWESKILATKSDNKTLITIVYLGSLGESYDLKMAIDAYEIAKTLIDTDISLEFKIIGDGQERKKLQLYSDELNSDVQFMGLMTHNQVQELLPLCDIAINPIVTWSVASIINKHADYALANLPVVNSQSNEEYRELLEHYNCGINTVPGDNKSMAIAISKLTADQELRALMSKNALRLANEKFNRFNTYPHLVKTISNLL